MKNLEDNKTKKSGFFTPDGYFDVLNDRLLTIPNRQETINQSIQEQAPRGFWGLLRPQLNLAASFVAVIVLGFGLIYIIHPAKGPAIVKQAQEQMVEDQSLVDPITSETQLSDEGIIQYLSDTDIDYYYLANKQ